MTKLPNEGHEDALMRDSGVFTFHAQLQGLHHRTIGVFVDVWDMQATLAFARLEDEKKHAVTVKHVHRDDLEAWGVTYQDLIDAVEASGAIDMGGWYPVTAKIAEAVKARETQALALFDTGNDCSR